MSKTIEDSCLEAAEALRKIAKSYFKLAKLESKFEEHYNQEGARALRLANWYFNRSKANAKFTPSKDATRTSHQQPLRGIPGGKE